MCVPLHADCKRCGEHIAMHFTADGLPRERLWNEEDGVVVFRGEKCWKQPGFLTVRGTMAT